MDILKIPHDRVAVLIGSGGETKRLIEEKAGIKLKISEEGEVEISGEDSFNEWRARDVIKAIGRGFNPKIALKLLNEDIHFELIDLDDILQSDKAKKRQKARIIGEDGRAWQTIEELSNAKVSVYGDTVAFIGTHEQIAAAKDAVLDLVRGARHRTAFIKLVKRRKE